MLRNWPNKMTKLQRALYDLHKLTVKIVLRQFIGEPLNID